MTRDERLDRLERRSDQLVAMFQEMDKRQVMLAHQLAEQNLRIRFTMHAFALTKDVPGGLVGADGKPQTMVSDLYNEYMGGGREKMLMRLEAEMQEMQRITKEQADAESSSVAEDATSAAGAIAPAAGTGNGGAREDPASIERPGGQSRVVPFTH